MISEDCRKGRGRSNPVINRKIYYVYLLTNKNDTVIYAGVTNDLVRRVYEHKNKLVPGFTSKYNVNKLVYFEECNDVNAAILREKQIKSGSRQDKINIINSDNPSWKDLSDGWY